MIATYKEERADRCLQSLDFVKISEFFQPEKKNCLWLSENEGHDAQEGVLL